MRGLLTRAAGLTTVYLLYMTSLEPGDIAAGAVFGLAVAWGLRLRHAARARTRPPERARAAVATFAETGREMVLGSWRVMRFCLGERAHPGLVEIPRDGRSPVAVALWGVLTGEAPDEVVVDVDEERDILIVHLIDASDPDGVRERHRRTLIERQRKVIA